MDILSYFEACAADTTYATPRELLVPPASLGFDVDGLVQDSENRVREIARTLFYKGGRIEAGGEIEGTATSVSFDCKTSARDKTYMGDLHNHPYQKKIGPTTHIGPSSGDYRQWLPFPSQNNATFHFVTCGNYLFLVVTRRGKTKVEFDYTAADNKVEMFLNEKMADNSDTLDCSPDNEPLKFRKWLEVTLPTVPAEWVRMHKDWQIDLATRHKFEVYFGDRAKTSVLELLSPPVYPRSWTVSPMHRAACSKCKATHASTHSSPFGRWHTCRDCGKIYCDKCGRTLRGISFSREKQCGCGGTTRLLY